MIRKFALLFVVLLIAPPVLSSSSYGLEKALDKIYGQPSTDSDRDLRFSKGVWNKNKTAYVISLISADLNLTYVFLNEGTDSYRGVKLWETSAEKTHVKLGRPLTYYDSYEIIPVIHGDISKSDLSVSLITRAWKDSQRYTTHSKPVFINSAGVLDWSHF